MIILFIRGILNDFFSRIYYRHDPLLLEELLSLTNNNTNAIAVMKYYLQTRNFDDVVDYQLILSLIKYVCQMRTGLLSLVFIDE
jgi:hypothetical protein